MSEQDNQGTWPSVPDQSAPEAAGNTPVPQSQPQYRYPQTSTMAIVALVLAALSYVSCPIVFAIVALILGNSADKEIKNSGGWVTGDGLITATKILAWINIGLGLLFVAVFGIFFLFTFLLAAAGA